jgi:HTH-type transcriptional regulator / antitoxin HigA
MVVISRRRLREFWEKHADAEDPLNAWFAIMSLKGHISASSLPADFKSLVRMYPPCAIHDDVAYENTQEIVDALTNLPKRSAGQDKYLETLSILMAKHEEQTERIGENVTPLDVLRHLMEEHQMTASDLGRLLGERSLGSKVLSGNRSFSKSHIAKLAAHFGVSPELFF